MTEQKENKPQAPKSEAQKKEDELRLIVRIMNKDLDGRLPIWRALLKIKGINQRTARMFAQKLEEQHHVPLDTVIGTLSEDMDKKLEAIIANPTQSGIPEWAQNRQADPETGVARHLVMNDLDFSKRTDLERMKKIKTYRGVRHMYGLPVRGQRTRGSFRKKGKTVGVMKKDAKKGKGGGAKK